MGEKNPPCGKEGADSGGTKRNGVDAGQGQTSCAAIPLTALIWRPIRVFRQARFRPLFDKGVETGAIQAALGDGMAPFTAGGAELHTEQEPAGPTRANEMKPEYKDGKPPTPSKMRTLGPQAHVKNGVRIPWEHSPLSGCDKGARCSYNHSAIG